MVVEIPYVEINNYKLPLLKTKMECSKLNKEHLVYALPDTGSRFSILDRDIFMQCFDENYSKRIDIIFLANLSRFSERYKIRFNFLEINKMAELPVAILEFNKLNPGIYPGLILGKDDFFSGITICFDKNNKIIIKEC
jgi:hypothetical protein